MTSTELEYVKRLIEDAKREAHFNVGAYMHDAIDGRSYRLYQFLNQLEKRVEALESKHE